MRTHVLGVALAGLGISWGVHAAPLPPALDKFHKEGIRLVPEKPSIIQGEVKPGGTAENHLLQLTKGQTYQFDLSAGFPANFRVVDAESGGVIFSGEKAKEDFIAPKDGLFRVLVGSPSGATGKYALSVLHRRAPLVIDPPGVRSVPREGLSIASNIMAGDPMDKVRRHLCKTFDVRLAGGKAYQIDMMGAFDTYLRLEDPTGKQIAVDDDGGEGLNSRMMINIPADGVYRVVCTSFSGGQGAFTLTVRQK